MSLYETIGKNYARTRRSDPRIAGKLLKILASSPTVTIADIGAGSGSYALALAEHRYRVLAVEPSATMRSQVIAHPAVEWLDGYAENLPLPDQSVDAAIIMLAFHHFQNSQKALSEAHRIVGNGQIILFTFDPEMTTRFWLTEYFPSFIEDVEATFSPIPQLVSELQTLTGSVINVDPFPLPHDLLDSFAAVGWARPELYLDGNVRNGISSFAKIDTEEISEGLSRLQADLRSGGWDKRYGHLRQQKLCDIGYRFVHSPAT